MKLNMVLVARVLAGVWAVFWLFFFVVESVVWRTPAPVLLSWAGLGLLFVMLALLPWRMEGPGGLLLVVAGLIAGLAYAIWAPPGLPLASYVITTVVFGGTAARGRDSLSEASSGRDGREVRPASARMVAC